MFYLLYFKSFMRSRLYLNCVILKQPEPEKLFPLHNLFPWSHYPVQCFQESCVKVARNAVRPATWSSPAP